MSWWKKLFGRWFGLAWDKGEYFSLYTYKTTQEEEEWYSFYAITWRKYAPPNEPTKVGWLIERD